MKLALYAAAFAVTLLAAPAFAGPPLRVHIINKSSDVITSFSLQIPGAKDGGTGNIAGKKGIAPGTKVDAMVANGVNSCVFAMAMRTKSGISKSAMLNMCNGHNTYTYNGRM